MRVINTGPPCFPTSKASLHLGFLPRFYSTWVCQQCSSRLRTKHDNRRPRQVSTPNPNQRLSSKISATPSFVGKRTSTIQRRGISTSSHDGEATTREDLPSQKEGRRSQVAKRFSHVMDHLQSNIFIAGQRLNDLTGYSGIEALKRDIETQGQSAL